MNVKFYLLATVLEGAAQGAQLLLCGGVPVWPEHPAACLEAQLPALQQTRPPGPPSRALQLYFCLALFAAFHALHLNPAGIPGTHAPI